MTGNVSGDKPKQFNVLNGNFKAIMIVLGLFISVLLASLPVFQTYGRVSEKLDNLTEKVGGKADRAMVDQRFSIIAEKLDMAKGERLKLMDQADEARKDRMKILQEIEKIRKDEACVSGGR